MAVRKKHDYKKICEERGEILREKVGTSLYIEDAKGFMHKMDTASLRRGAKLGITSVLPDRKSEYFINTLFEKWGDGISQYDFTDFVYDAVHTQTKVTCKFHGELEVRPSNILSSKFVCKGCLGEYLSGISTIDTKRFIEKCKKVHGDRYDYSKTKYTGNKNYVTVTCPEHGDFQVLARTHSSESQACGCIKCAVKSGFSRSTYATVCPEGSYVYVMEMNRGAEHFIKIGISKNPEERTISIARESGYEVLVLHKEFYLESSDAWDVEKILHREFKENLHTPKVSFRGETECFDLSIKDEAIKLLQCVA